jgi:hypothetical protein
MSVAYVCVGDSLEWFRGLISGDSLVAEPANYQVALQVCAVVRARSVRRAGVE